MPAAPLSDPIDDVNRSRPRPRALSGLVRLSCVAAGIGIAHAILFGPSLTGQKVLLPLDILALPNYYIPGPARDAQNFALADLVLQNEPSRRFVAAEIHAGRFPLWNPYEYAGVRHTSLPLSPFVLLSAMSESPRILPWIELLVAELAGVGMYVFCRRVLNVGFRPAVVVAWCYPLTGFFVLWRGYWIPYSVVGLPWILLAVHATVRREGRLAPVGLAVVTALVLVSGRLDIAGQVLLTSGLFALWCLLDTFRREASTRRALFAAGRLAIGWTLGLLLATPSVWPILEYARTGYRMMNRGAGKEERPPLGLGELPHLVLPDMYGSTERDSLLLPIHGAIRVLPESAAAGYPGILAALLAAPLAWRSRRHRSLSGFWVFLTVLTLGWSLNVPGIVWLLRLPGLNMSSHNRFVFATAFAILALAAVGLDAVQAGGAERRRWYGLPAALLAGTGAWCLWRAIVLPEPVRSRLTTAALGGHPIAWVTTVERAAAVQAWFVRGYLAAAVLCGVGVAGWIVLWRRRGRGGAEMSAALGAVLLADLLWFAHGRDRQCDPALYYPRLPVLEELSHAAPGRMLCYHCLPAAIAQIHRLRDIRGYDSIDPARLIDVLMLAHPRPGADFARTQWFEPEIGLVRPDGVRLPPVLDMLGVRYVVFRGRPPAQVQPLFRGDDYWVLVNKTAMPRAFVPERVVTVFDDRTRLGNMERVDFDPARTAYVETAVTLPTPCRGAATIVHEHPTQVTVQVDMETPGLVVLADLWDPGWRAYLDGNAVPILRANHAVRGVVAPAGKATIEFRYEPGSLRWAIRLALGALVVLTIWLAAPLVKTRALPGPAPP